MSNSPDPNSGASQHNQQYNQASRGGSVYANQGDGTQSITHYNNFATKVRSWTGWAVLVFLVVDVAFFIYGRNAYTGREGDSGDLWRAGIFLVLLVITVNLTRRWFRRRI